MKKLVAGCALGLILILCGCSKSSLGESAELAAHEWHAETEGGGKVSLSFNGDRARFTLENGGDTEVIEGEYAADESCFIIFDSSVCQNYRFEYTPHGETLEISYEGNTIKMLEARG